MKKSAAIIGMKRKAIGWVPPISSPLEVDDAGQDECSELLPQFRQELGDRLVRDFGPLRIPCSATDGMSKPGIDFDMSNPWDDLLYQGYPGTEIYQILFGRNEQYLGLDGLQGRLDIPLESRGIPDAEIGAGLQLIIDIPGILRAKHGIPVTHSFFPLAELFQRFYICGIPIVGVPPGPIT
jgi:hypothetical protein